MLKKLPIKKHRPDKGVKGSHPNQSMWHKTRTPEEKAEYRRKISEGMRKYHAKRTVEQEQERARKLSETRKKVFFKTYAGHTTKLYMGYLFSQYQASLTPEERAATSSKQSAATRKIWEGLTPEERERRLNAWLKTDVINTLFEKEVPRKKTFCGVVREDRM